MARLTSLKNSATAQVENTVRFISSIHQIGADTWRELSNTGNPFLRFEFLAALEDCQCIDSPTQKTPLNSGWIPSYAILENDKLESYKSEKNELEGKTKILAVGMKFLKDGRDGEYLGF